MRILISDSETTPFDYKLNDNYELKARFFCFIDLFTNERLFVNIEKNGKQVLKDYILSLTSLKNPTRIYFHNLRFDLAFLYELLPTKDFKYNVIKSGSKIIQFKIYKEYKRLKKDKKSYRIEKKTFLDIRDSLVLFLSSVETLGNALGFPKLKQDYFVKEITQEYINYCYRDIEIIQTYFFKLQELCKEKYNFDLNLNKLPLTLPSLAKRLFHFLNEKKYGKKILKDIYDIKDDMEQIFRKFYYGGRVEVLNFNYLNNGYYNDFNSHYPAIMFENEFPIPPYHIYKCANNEKCFNAWKTNKLIFGCFCIVNETLDIPLLATKVNGKLIFGKGIKEVFLFRKEIEYLLSLKQKIIITSIVSCNKYLPIFKEYINISYEIKKNSNDLAIKLISKYLMNQLYGKFAEKKEKERFDILHDITGLPEKELREISITSKGFLKRTDEYHDTLKTNIIFSMMITALARLKIHKYIMKTKDPFYTDSDSIVSFDIIENSNELGKMSIEFQFVKFQALGCKEYVYENKNNEITIKMKGFGNIRKTQKQYFENFSNFIINYKKGIKQNRLIGFFEAFVRDMPFTSVLVYDKFKQNVYDKRWINKDLTTKAFHLQNDDFNELIENNRIMIEKIIKNYQNN